MNVIDILKSAVASTDLYLYKYYNDDEIRDPDIPDILDDLYEQYDKIILQENKFSSCESYISIRDKTLALIDKIEEERNEFYIIERKNTNIIMAQPVDFREYPIRKPYITNEEQIGWIYTGETVIVPGFTKIYASGNSDYFLIHLDDKNTHYYNYRPYILFEFQNLIESDEYIGYESLDKYWQKKKAEGHITKFRVCSTCGEIFSISPSEVNWYALKELKLPKRCKEHRGYKHHT